MSLILKPVLSCSSHPPPPSVLSAQVCNSRPTFGPTDTPPYCPQPGQHAPDPGFSQAWAAGVPSAKLQGVSLGPPFSLIAPFSPAGTKHLWNKSL